MRTHWRAQEDAAVARAGRAAAQTKAGRIVLTDRDVGEAVVAVALKAGAEQSLRLPLCL